MSVCDGCPAMKLDECGENYGCSLWLWDYGRYPSREKDRPHNPPDTCPHAEALKQASDNPEGGRLVFIPWQAGGKVVPKIGW